MDVVSVPQLPSATSVPSLIMWWILGHASHAPMAAASAHLRLNVPSVHFQTKSLIHLEHAYPVLMAAASALPRVSVPSALNPTTWWILQEHV